MHNFILLPTASGKICLEGKVKGCFVLIIWRRCSLKAPCSSILCNQIASVISSSELKVTFVSKCKYPIKSILDT